jgi:uncharacterized protein
VTTYHDGSRRLQDRFDTRRLADRIDDKLVARGTIDEDDRAFIERCDMVFVATADADGRPNCSYKGGDPGFVRVLDERTIAFPSYDGNGMFRSLGNVLVNPKVGMLFVDFERPNRMRINGIASLHDDDELLSSFEGAQLIVRVHAERIFPNCPRYIHKMQVVEHSVYSPRPGHVPPVPDWKQMDVFRDYLPED